MKKYFNIIGIAFVLLLPIKSISQTFKILKWDNYVPKSISTVEKKYWATEFGALSTYLNMYDDVIIVKKEPASDYSGVTYLKSDIGLLLGFNEGEWKGGLFSKIKDGNLLLIKKCNVKLLHENPQGDVVFFNVNNSERKSTLELAYRDSISLELKIKEISSLPDVPTSYAYIKGKLFIAGINNLYTFNGEKFVPFFKKDEWKNIFVNSILDLDGTDLLLGISGGIIKLNTTTKSWKLYVEKIK